MNMRRMRHVAVRVVSGRRVRADIARSEASVRASVVPGRFSRSESNQFFYVLLDYDEFFNRVMRLTKTSFLSKLAMNMAWDLRGLD